MSRRVPKPWGHELIRAETDRSVGKILHIKAGESFRITPHLRHRMSAASDCDILEASTPELEDVVLLDDRHGRAAQA